MARATGIARAVASAGVRVAGLSVTLKTSRLPEVQLDFDDAGKHASSFQSVFGAVNGVFQ